MLSLVLLCAVLPAALLDALPSQCVVHDDGSCVVGKHSGCTSDKNTDDCTYTTVDDDYDAEVVFLGSHNCDSTNDDNAQAPVDDLTLAVKPYDHTYFLLSLEWTQSTIIPNAIEKGFIIVIEPDITNKDRTPLGTFCYTVDSPNITSTTFLMKYAYYEHVTECYEHYADASEPSSEYYPINRDIEVDIWPEPRSLSTSPKKAIHWPNNCYDISPVNYSICGPPSPGLIYDDTISIQQHYLTDETYGIALNWSHPLNVPASYQPQNYRVIIHDNNFYHSTFTVTDSTNVHLEPFQTNTSYQVEVIGFQKCARSKECILPFNETAKIRQCGKFVGRDSIYGYKPFSFPPRENVTSTSTGMPSTTSIIQKVTPIITSSSLVFQTTTSSPAVSTPFPTVSTPLSTISTLSPTPDTALAEKLSSTMIIVICTVIVVVVMAIVVILLVTCLCCRWCQDESAEKGVEPRCTPSPPTTPPYSPSPLLQSPRYTFSKIQPKVLPPKAKVQPPKPAISLVPWHRVVVVMSNRLPENETTLVYAFLKSGLEKRGIEVEMYDQGVAGCGPPLWLDRVLKNCSKIICVCNKQFAEEWDGQYTEGSPVHALGILVNSHINRGKYPTDLFMVSVVTDEDKKHVPYYIGSGVFYKIEQIDDIYRGITGEAKYETV